MTRTALLITFCLWLCACATAAEPPAPKPMVSSGAMITFSTTPCFGICPVVDAYLFEEGKILYRGYRPVWQGRPDDADPRLNEVIFDLADLGEDSFDALVAYLDEAGFFGLQDSYYGADCGRQASDHSGVRIAVRDRTREKVLTYNYGCQDFPDEARLHAILAELQNRLGIDDFIEERLPRE